MAYSEAYLIHPFLKYLVTPFPKLKQAWICIVLLVICKDLRKYPIYKYLAILLGKLTNAPLSWVYITMVRDQYCCHMAKAIVFHLVCIKIIECDTVSAAKLQKTHTLVVCSPNNSV